MDSAKWPPAAAPRVSSFGFGGTNFHAVLEEYTGPNAHPKRIWPDGPELVAAQRARYDALRKSCLETAALCETDSVPVREYRSGQPIRIRCGAAASRGRRGHRLARRCRANCGSWRTGKRFTRHFDQHRKSWRASSHSCFPGQGSQYLNMGAELAMTFPDAMAVWEKAPETASVVFPPRAFSHR